MLYDIIKGTIIGVANIIPGVSGGTMAVSMGIYDKIIVSVTHLFSDFKKSIKTLFPLAIGMLIGIVGLSFIIEYMFANFPFQTNMLFIGLILGGVPSITKRIDTKKIGIPNGIVFIAFFALIIGMQLLNSSESSDATIVISLVEIIKLFVIGVIASATMVVPGVSGSMMLMLLGYYTPILTNINTFIKSLVSLNFSMIFQSASILIPFGIGVVVGIFVIAKIIEILLSKYENLTFCAILGLIIASPIAILMGVNLNSLLFSEVIIGILCLIVGGVIALLLGKE